MKHNFSVRLVIGLSLLAALLSGQAGKFAPALGAASGTASADAETQTPALCFHVFLPLVFGGGGAAMALPAAPANSLPCAGFPDFNGDGYADLAIGVPRKEVFDGLVNVVDAGVVQVIYGSLQGLNAAAGAPKEDQIWHRELGGVEAGADDLYGRSMAMGDFNQDGYADLAVGIPGARIDAKEGAGAVQVIYGSENGLAAAGIQEWTRGHAGLQGATVAFDNFGASMAAGDFDHDGYADLAVGVPQTTVNSEDDAGGVAILYGGPTGLTSVGNEWLTQDTNGFTASSAEADDEFGWALATGDFNGDDIADLAVGTPLEGNGASFSDAGAVQIFFGLDGTHGLDGGIIRLGSVVGPQHWTAASPNVEGAMEAGEHFGHSLAAGNFNGDAYDDLAVGIPQEDHGTGPDTIVSGGAINVFDGGASGLVSTPSNPARLWHQEVASMADEVAAYEQFGFSLAAADFDNDGYTDLAIGVPENQFLGVAIGAAHLMYGTSGGLTADDDELLYDSIHPDSFDLFGAHLTAGDFDGDGFADLAVSAFADDPVGVAETGSGSLFAFYGSAAGPAQASIQYWYPSHNGLRGVPDTDDWFGVALPGSPDIVN
ncbi:MAG: FG-GAP repeat protein [Anaerolineales bacterium]